MTRRLQRGDKVRDRYGKVHEVMHQIGTTVYLYGCSVPWIHRSNCTKVEA